MTSLEEIKVMLQDLAEDCKQSREELLEQNKKLENRIIAKVKKHVDESLEPLFDQIRDMRHNFDGFQKALEQVELDIKDKVSYIEIGALESRVMRMERDSRRLNLMLSGVADTAGETRDALLAKVKRTIGKYDPAMAGSLQISPRCTLRMGEFQDAKSRRIKITLSSWEDKLSLLKLNKMSFKDKIFFDEDLTPEQQKEKMKLRAYLRGKDLGKADYKWTKAGIIINGELYVYNSRTKKVEIRN